LPVVLGYSPPPASELDRVLGLRPQLHRDGKGGVTSWALSEEVLRYIADCLCPGMATLETGLGVSTLVFALGRCHHTTIAHHPDEVDNLHRFCSKHGVSLDRVAVINGRSEQVLPRLEPEPLDLVLIDGRHAFPSPFVDWYYTVERLRIGGLMVVDDIQLRTGAILAEFMAVDHRFEEDARFENTAAFRKLGGPINQGEYHLQAWMMQRQAT